MNLASRTVVCDVLSLAKRNMTPANVADRDMEGFIRFIFSRVNTIVADRYAWATPQHANAEDIRGDWKTCSD